MSPQISTAALEQCVFQNLWRAQRVAQFIAPIRVIPLFHIVTAEDDWMFSVPMPKDTEAGRRLMELLRDFMALKRAVAFVVAGEISAPNALWSIGVSPTHQYGLMSLVQHDPLSFGDPVVFDPAQTGIAVPSLVPTCPSSLPDLRRQEIEITFGPNGSIPATRLAKPGTSRAKANAA
ncbi:MAG: hypothetical protein P9E88_05255 [Candidatus Competibacter sp.]|nr:hypothetical protein [Candidatus Competibacter sp.]